MTESTMQRMTRKAKVAINNLEDRIGIGPDSLGYWGSKAINALIGFAVLEYSAILLLEVPSIHAAVLNALSQSEKDARTSEHRPIPDSSVSNQDPVITRAVESTREPEITLAPSTQTPTATSTAEKRIDPPEQPQYFKLVEKIYNNAEAISPNAIICLTDNQSNQNEGSTIALKRQTREGGTITTKASAVLACLTFDENKGSYMLLNVPANTQSTDLTAVNHENLPVAIIVLNDSPIAGGDSSLTLSRWEKLLPEKIQKPTKIEKWALEVIQKLKERKLYYPPSPSGRAADAGQVLTTE